MVTQKDMSRLSAIKQNGQPMSCMPALCLQDICLSGDMSVPPSNASGDRCHQGKGVPWQRTTQAQVAGMLRVQVSIHTTEFSGPHPKARWPSRKSQGTGAVSPFVRVLCCAFSLLKSTQSCVEYPEKEGAEKEGWSPPGSPGILPHPTTSTEHWLTG